MKKKASKASDESGAGGSPRAKGSVAGAVIGGIVAGPVGALVGSVAGALMGGRAKKGKPMVPESGKELLEELKAIGKKTPAEPPAAKKPRKAAGSSEPLQLEDGAKPEAPAKAQVSRPAGAGPKAKAATRAKVAPKKAPVRKKAQPKSSGTKAAGTK